MRSLHQPLRAGPAALLLVLCLLLGLNKALENPRHVMIFDLDMPWRAKPNEIVNLRLELETELQECMVVKAYLQSIPKIEGAFNYVYTGCLCEDNPLAFTWDFHSTRTAKITILVDIIDEKNICTEDISVIPNEATRYYAVRTLFIG